MFDDPPFLDLETSVADRSEVGNLPIITQIRDTFFILPCQLFLTINYISMKKSSFVNARCVRIFSAFLLVCGMLCSSPITHAQWLPASPSGYIYYNGSVGIGTSTQPVSTLDVYGTVTGDVSNTPAFVSKSGLGFVIEQGNIGNDFVSSASYYSIFAHNVYYNGSQWIRRNQYSNSWATVMNHNFYDIQVGMADGSQPANQPIPTTTVLRILPSGNVLIGGTTQVNSGYKLDVSGNLRANEVVVNTTGADFVFKPGYALMPLAELGRYLQTWHHLPGIAPAQEMKEKGLDVGEGEKLLLQKVEELTLYMLEEQKQIDRLKRQNKRLESMLKRQSHH